MTTIPRTTTSGSSVRIAFFGTPEFATAALRALIGEGHDVVVVVTPVSYTHLTLPTILRV